MREVVFRGEGFELPLLVSDVLPAAFHHGFTTRRGGVSRAPFDTLNLGGRWSDAPDAVAENRRRLRAAARAPAICFATQVHGAGVVRADVGTAPAVVAATEADAVVAGGPGVVAGVAVADCVPVLIADARTGAAAAVHAGWRGAVAGVVTAALVRMAADLGTRPDDVRLAIGPSIGPCCFEVGPEVVAAVEAAWPSARGAGAIVDRQPRPHVDLWRLARLAAESWGVRPEAIDVAAVCTSCQRDRFFSYRRDGGKTGQMAAFITAARPAAAGER